jgi:hypothetical protein
MAGAEVQKSELLIPFQYQAKFFLLTHHVEKNLDGLGVISVVAPVSTVVETITVVIQKRHE